MIKITEVATRDGFQSVSQWIPTEVKTEIMDALIDCGITRIDVTSFVHPKFVPQMKDADEVYKHFAQTAPANVDGLVLVPNLYGAKRALQLGAKHIAWVCSATDRHNMENTKRTIDQTLEELKELVAMKGDAKILFGQACSFVCPFTGPVDPKQAVSVLSRALEIGADEISVCDTTGTANPAMIRALIQECKRALPGVALPSLHLHDTYGMGLANVLEALELGVETFDAACSGIGGCPFTPGATGNIATEDMVGMLEDMGIKTGIDQDKLMAVSMMIREKISGCCAASHRGFVATQRKKLGLN